MCDTVKMQYGKLANPIIDTHATLVLNVAGISAGVPNEAARKGLAFAWLKELSIFEITSAVTATFLVHGSIRIPQTDGLASNVA